METRQLKYFITIAKYGSFTAAAEAICVAQPALSTQIAKLEAELGGELFTRSKRGVELTALGREFRPHAIDIWERIEQARRIGRKNAQTLSEVTIGFPPLIALFLIGPLIQAVQSRLPNVALRLREAMTPTLRDMLIGRELDLALRYIQPGEPPARAEPIFREQLFLGAKRGFGIRLDDGTRPQTLFDLPLVLSTPGTTHRMLLEDFAKRRHAELNVVAEVDSITGQRDLVLKGAGATVLPLAGFHGWPSDDLEIVPLHFDDLVSRAGLFRSSVAVENRQLSRVSALLCEVMTELIESGRWPGMSFEATPPIMPAIVALTRVAASDVPTGKA